MAFFGDWAPLLGAVDAMPLYLVPVSNLPPTPSQNKAPTQGGKHIQILHQAIGPLRAAVTGTDAFQNPRHLALANPLQHVDNRSKMDLLCAVVAAQRRGVEHGAQRALGVAAAQHLADLGCDVGGGGRVGWRRQGAWEQRLHGEVGGRLAVEDVGVDCSVVELGHGCGGAGGLLWRGWRREGLDWIGADWGRMLWLLLVSWW